MLTHVHVNMACFKFQVDEIMVVIEKELIEMAQVEKGGPLTMRWSTNKHWPPSQMSLTSILSCLFSIQPSQL